IAAAARNQRVTQSGKPSAGLNCDSPCPSAHTAPAYNIPARRTLRRFNSAKKPGLSDATFGIPRRRQAGFQTGAVYRFDMHRAGQATRGVSRHALNADVLDSIGPKAACRDRRLWVESASSPRILVDDF